MAKGKGLGKGAKGLGGAKRHRKVLRDNLQGMTKPMIQRLARRGGVMRLEVQAYEEIRGIMMYYLQQIMLHTVTAVQHQRMRTVQLAHLKMGYQMATGNHYMGGAHSASQAAPLVHQHNAKKPTADGKPHRFRPGTVALNDIRFYQKHSDRAVIPLASFARLCREVAQDYQDDLRFEEGVFTTLRFMVENYLVHLFTHANRLAIHCARLSVSAQDVQMVRAIRGDRA